ncbi:hypothetical protein TNCV_1958481 [Trichonephila clavipes]|nr:hypothetical protein TNCV_1958481 [Trichonephila clavipes]
MQSQLVALLVYRLPCTPRVAEGLGALDKINFMVPFRVVRVQMPPSGEETKHQNYKSDWYCTYLVLHFSVIPSPGGYARSAKDRSSNGNLKKVN